MGKARANRNAGQLEVLALAEILDTMAASELRKAGLPSRPEKPRMLRRSPSYAAQLRYIRYLAARASQYIDQGRASHAANQLNFALGVLWSCGAISPQNVREIRNLAKEGFNVDTYARN